MPLSGPISKRRASFLGAVFFHFQLHMPLAKSAPLYYPKGADTISCVCRLVFYQDVVVPAPIPPYGPSPEGGFGNGQAPPDGGNYHTAGMAVFSFCLFFLPEKAEGSKI
jgi:hypothetical protein